MHNHWFSELANLWWEKQAKRKMHGSVTRHSNLVGRLMLISVQVGNLIKLRETGFHPDSTIPLQAWC